MLSIPATFFRGGTSKALIFAEKDLPQDRTLWDEIFLKAMGSPDSYGRQLNGMGGGVSSLSKVCVVRPSQRADADVEYIFAQILIEEAKVDYKGNCGNISSAVGPWAVEHGLVKATSGSLSVRLYNVNTDKVIESIFPVKDGKPVYEGELSIPGVSGTGAPIRLNFLKPGGATTGKLLPTGRVQQELFIPELHKSFNASLVDAANACVFVKAEDLGLLGTESPLELSQLDVLQKLKWIRTAASVAMGIAKDAEGAQSIPTVPYLVLVSKSQVFKTLEGKVVDTSEQDLCVRVLASGQIHQAVPLTVSLCTAIAAQLEGSLVSTLLAQDANFKTLRLGMPSGVLTVAAEVQRPEGQWEALSGGFYRTARPLFEGHLFY